MKRKAFLTIALLTLASILPLMVFKVQATLSAGPNQQVYTGETVTFNAATTENVTAISQITWDFGDNTTLVNGTTSELLNTSHVYAAAGIYNANLTVKFDTTLNKTETAIAVITVIQNHPPVADAGPDQSLEQTSPEGADVTLDGTSSTDPDGDPLTYLWNWTTGSATGPTPTVLFPLGNTTVTLTVQDSQLNATDTVNIVVLKDSTSPTVDAGPSLTIEQGTPVVLNGTATDNISTLFNFTWSTNGTELKTETNQTTTVLNYTFNLGTHLIALTATDNAGNTGSDNVTVTVVDTTPPEINATATPTTMWPPNHKYVEVKINVTASDFANQPTITLESFTSNEPIDDKGDGNTTMDIDKLDDFTFNIRAERSGPSSGRTYTLTYKATDSSGNFAITTVTVEVPHNQ